jgi:hypothetical protein
MPTPGPYPCKNLAVQDSVEEFQQGLAESTSMNEEYRRREEETRRLHTQELKAQEDRLNMLQEQEAQRVLAAHRQQFRYGILRRSKVSYFLEFSAKLSAKFIQSRIDKKFNISLRRIAEPVGPPRAVQGVGMGAATMPPVYKPVNNLEINNTTPHDSQCTNKVETNEYSTDNQHTAVNNTSGGESVVHDTARHKREKKNHVYNNNNMNNGRSKNSKNRDKKGTKDLNLTLSAFNCRSINNKKVSINEMLNSQNLDIALCSELNLNWKPPRFKGFFSFQKKSKRKD